MATYAQVMELLAALYRADEAAVNGALRGRIQNLQRLGVPVDQKTGRGKRIEYGRREIYQIVLALELAEIGISPSQSAKLVIGNWKTIWPQISAHLRDQVKIWEEARLALVSSNQLMSSWSQIEAGFTPLRMSSLEALAQSDNSPGYRRHLCVLKIFQIVRDVESEIERIGIKMEDL